MEILDGKKISEEIQQELAVEVNNLKKGGRKIPHLAAVLVGNNPASETYVNAKIKSCEKAGFRSTLRHLPVSITESDLLHTIEDINKDDDIDGFIVQLPLPAHIQEQRIIESVDPQKDVDGFHPVNVGKMALNHPSFLPATPYGILILLERYKIPTEGKNCVILGRSNIVGTPMALLLSRKGYPGNCTVSLCHSRTNDLESYTRNADILIVALGRHDFVNAGMVKDGAVVIDVGINRIKDVSKKSGFRLTGDVKFDEVAPRCSYITPVPGGVGPMTIAALLTNTLKAVKGKEVNGKR